MKLKVEVTKAIIKGCGAAWPPNLPISVATMIAVMGRQGIHVEAEDVERFSREIASGRRGTFTETLASFANGVRSWFVRINEEDGSIEYDLPRKVSQWIDKRVMSDPEASKPFSFALGKPRFLGLMIEQTGKVVAAEANRVSMAAQEPRPKRTGKPAKPGQRVCQFTGCIAAARQRGFCDFHYRQVARSPYCPWREPCIEEGCPRGAEHKDGRCSICNNKYKRRLVRKGEWEGQESLRGKAS